MLHCVNSNNRAVLFMQMIVDRVMSTARPCHRVSLTELRSRVGGYIELLSSTGKPDPDELAMLGTAYLQKILDGPDSRFTGC
jgi:hypothetical protein